MSGGGGSEMSVLPDELWRWILEMGVKTSRLNYRDLCCISMTCRRLNRLSNEDDLWAALFALDFPSAPLLSAAGTIQNLHAQYRIRFEICRSSMLHAHRRDVHYAQSRVALCSKNIQDLRDLLQKERERMKETLIELQNLRAVRQASVALNVWQPEVVRGRQKQIVEQCKVPVEQRVSSLEMELKLCQNQIETLSKALDVQKIKLNKGEEHLASLKYRPLYCGDFKQVRGNHGVKRKKLKECSHELRETDEETLNQRRL